MGRYKRRKYWSKRAGVREAGPSHPLRLPSSPPPLPTKIGTSGFSDSQLSQTYNYQILQPYTVHQLPAGCHSLKDLASKTLAHVLFSAHDRSSPSYLSYLIDSCPVSDSWALWKKVWHYIVYSERDSPTVFQLFYSKFGSSDSFQCHYLPTIRQKRMRDYNIDRASYIITNSLSRKHRFETIYSNVSINSLVVNLNQFSVDSLVILNLTGVDVSKSYHFISNLSNLYYINLSRCNVDDTILKSFSIAMSSGKLPHLECILVSGNPRLKGTGASLPAQIQYLESTRNEYVPVGFSCIDSAAFVNLTDSLKFKYLIDHFLIENVDIRRKLILDYRVVNEPCPLELEREDLEDVWTKRASNVRAVESFIRSDGGNVTEYGGHPSTVRREDTKKRRRVNKVDFKKFFDI
ncbi:DEKNAAC103850 [Brettanomyces naardenensis]|uniref:DEKNAAC103850 n=1 Tax=Brettanomyces naardenensis TaxID=13370 RepID=A0A448YPK2_BRENA|nr:DEKNAAC103850 [Brettanomyces naardenensis]